MHRLRSSWPRSARCASAIASSTPLGGGSAAPAAAGVLVPAPALAVERDLDLKPGQIVRHLDQHIVGQTAAKRAVSVALRNRWRRHQLSSVDRQEIMPKNILLVGPTGCGKTEIARRLGRLANAPFVKVEATKFTETGFHGRDVDQILKDLIDVSIKICRDRRRVEIQTEVDRLVEDRLLTALAGKDAAEQDTFRPLLQQGQLDNQIITIPVSNSPSPSSGRNFGSIVPDSADQSSDIIISIKKLVHSQTKQMTDKEMSVCQARPILQKQESDRLLDTSSEGSADLINRAIELAEQNGIVFIDEIDKICSPRDAHRSAADASAEGVQRDLLPLIEGSIVNTKHGNICTDHILFIASGAFHSCRPSDLLAELQGRLPIRVDLKGLTQDDLYRILTEPQHNLIKQQVALLSTELIDLSFTDEAIREIAKTASVINEMVENLGARRLHTIVEHIMADHNFNGPDYAVDQRRIIIDENYVKDKCAKLVTNVDLKRYIL